MKLTDDPLWSRLQAFELDVTGDALTFTRRLARENDWTHDFARRVAEEYRRFIYLAIRAGHPVTPSDEVDQAWHLHLIYTHSYWDELCTQVLQRPLHHGPTRGGRAEDAKYHDWYAKTLESYARVFGREAPTDIWPDSAQRFSRKIRWQRVNTAAHWLVPKNKTRRLASMAAGGVIFGGVLAACSGGSDGVGIGGWLLIGVLGITGLYSYFANRKPQSNRQSNNDTSGTSGCSGVGLGSGCSSSSPTHHSHDRDHDHGHSHHHGHDHNHSHDNDSHSSSHDGDSGGGSSDSGGGGDSGCSSSGCGGGCGGGD
ncbi:glycine-rich domain-containing protein [Brevifollis gellanilyticus]|uniref:TIGR04222 domain-containing membrane protein n=1 Tax=Brevifollis gellanilyticus TaxID=748831 RepID=A0A512MB33_9BACT|nr:hypothetical protein [Brevifollis gellanilyticus]GEP43946.1 hypothetical protein BGE01nite_32370 [Brevifollis gellanilyticus]